MTTPNQIQIHASCVDLAGVAVLLRGPSGSGKSDLCLRLIDGGARLVADDRTDLTLERGVLIASPPPLIAGKLEVRGIGIVPVPATARARVGLAVDLVTDEIERMPEPQACSYLGVEIPLVAMHAFEASATAKVRLLAHRSSAAASHAA